MPRPPTNIINIDEAILMPAEDGDSVQFSLDEEDYEDEPDRGYEDEEPRAADEADDDATQGSNKVTTWQQNKVRLGSTTARSSRRKLH